MPMNANAHGQARQSGMFTPWDRPLQRTLLFAFLCVLCDSAVNVPAEGRLM